MVCIFNDALKTFYVRLYGVGYRVKDHSGNEREHSLSFLHELLFPIKSKGSFTCTIINERERERNVLFNDALNTFLSTVIWRQTYG